MVMIGLMWAVVRPILEKRYECKQIDDHRDDDTRVLDLSASMKAAMSNEAASAILRLHLEDSGRTAVFNIEIHDNSGATVLTDEASVAIPTDSSGALTMTVLRPRMSAVTGMLDQYLVVRQEPFPSHGMRGPGRGVFDETMPGGIDVGSDDRHPAGIPSVINPIGGFHPSGSLVGPGHGLFQGRGERGGVRDPDAPNPLGTDGDVDEFSKGLPDGERPLPKGAVPPGARFDPFGPV
ncbi:proteasome inhibitor PI31 subunit [Carpediemonas membranifera]|uniref:Proteasome inhibitor PI31 subunit n=1 Tax=Carpediemonas membranifera TaxID=201153 RepID=A0A8J6E4M3_9EUKA|nr:proteasome inhibitor PI31 subunit [Carpediemonas membranifera]|eukprot:KAG9394672.1 proteasome inhibitor PI31 subunit [Carpediemonas membranifera]